ncbi:MAG TPA: aminopeptidase P family protein [Phycisphaerae bacterium]|nr:aminopeptidase P family protein [Phycisphaerae bacterium]
MKDNTDRQDAICRIFRTRRRKALKLAGCQASCNTILISNPFDVEYLTGFNGGDSYLLIGQDVVTLVTDSRYTEQAGSQCGPDVQIFTRKSPMSKAVALALKGSGTRRLGIQSLHATVALAESLQELLGKKAVIPLKPFIYQLRMIKDDAELVLMRKAYRIAVESFCELVGRGASYWLGRTELQIAAELDYLMVSAGATKPAFDTIVAAGEAASMPHHATSARKIRPGQGILLDFGARYRGYCSDLTRVVFVGKIPPRISRFYETVYAAQQAAIDAIRPGVKACRVDAVARGIIADAGYGENFLHSLGHGLGLEVHEMPTLSALSSAVLRKGMVVTVEPAIYLPRVGGVRIEDDVEITASGARLLGAAGRKNMDDMILQ